MENLTILILSAILLSTTPQQINIDLPKEEINIQQVQENAIQNVTSEERYLVARIVKCESGNQPLEVQKQVASSIFNRVKDERFPNTITEVIYAPNQYTPTMLPSWFEKWQPDENSYLAVDEVIKYGTVSDCLYFESCKGSSWHSRNLELVYSNGVMRFYK